MTDTLFSAPHNATEAELRSMGFDPDLDMDTIRKEEESASHDVRWTTIYDLYHLRADTAGMESALAQIMDRAWAAELTYKDVVPSAHFAER